ncbi:MAG: serine hydrolase [Nostoc sp.]|uniref:serine hydrolase n=1 Tax=unclassified Nostoc TaxID=2593658 RepID=UPI002FF7568B|nr:serine hydrolase [Nostoc sp. NMS7]
MISHRADRRKLKFLSAGDLQYKRAGIKLSVMETVNKMITISDNTASNMIIDRQVSRIVYQYLAQPKLSQKY